MGLGKRREGRRREEKGQKEVEEATVHVHGPLGVDAGSLSPMLAEVRLNTSVY